MALSKWKAYLPLSHPMLSRSELANKEMTRSKQQELRTFILVISAQESDITPDQIAQASEIWKSISSDAWNGGLISIYCTSAAQHLPKTENCIRFLGEGIISIPPLPQHPAPPPHTSLQVSLLTDTRVQQLSTVFFSHGKNGGWEWGGAGFEVKMFWEKS